MVLDVFFVKLVDKNDGKEVGEWLRRVSPKLRPYESDHCG